MFVIISRNNLTFQHIIHAKLGIPYYGTYLNCTLIFEWYVAKCGSKNEYQKPTCLIEIELCVQNMVIMYGKANKVICKVEEMKSCI